MLDFSLDARVLCFTLLLSRHGSFRPAPALQALGPIWPARSGRHCRRSAPNPSAAPRSSWRMSPSRSPLVGAVLFLGASQRDQLRHASTRSTCCAPRSKSKGMDLAEQGGFFSTSCWSIPNCRACAREPTNSSPWSGAGSARHVIEVYEPGRWWETRAEHERRRPDFFLRWASPSSLPASTGAPKKSPPSSWSRVRGRYYPTGGRGRPSHLSTGRSLRSSCGPHGSLRTSQEPLPFIYIPLAQVPSREDGSCCARRATPRRGAGVRAAARESTKCANLYVNNMTQQSAIHRQRPPGRLLSASSAVRAAAASSASTASCPLPVARRTHGSACAVATRRAARRHPSISSSAGHAPVASSSRTATASR